MYAGVYESIILYHVVVKADKMKPQNTNKYIHTVHMSTYINTYTNGCECRYTYIHTYTVHIRTSVSSPRVDVESFFEYELETGQVTTPRSVHGSRQTVAIFRVDILFGRVCIHSCTIPTYIFYL